MLVPFLQCKNTPGAGAWGVWWGLSTVCYNIGPSTTQPAGVAETQTGACFCAKPLPKSALKQSDRKNKKNVGFPPNPLTESSTYYPKQAPNTLNDGYTY